MAAPGSVHILGPAYPVATGGYLRGDGQGGVVWADQRDGVSVEVAEPHIIVRAAPLGSRLDRETARRVADALREMAEQLP